ncbi:Arginyl-tRNA--protein transferase 1 [Mortierella sp. GBA30]|nr:Arginyl-tRNA--protein transferase 1 [Mortierella sp. GBA30]
MQLKDFSVITPYDSNVSSCGYCKSSGGSHTYGMSAHFMTCKDYQKLINRGWRRMKANEFEASKHQRQVVNRFNHYIQEGDDNFEKDIVARHQESSGKEITSTTDAGTPPASTSDANATTGAPDSTPSVAIQGKKQKPRKAPKNTATDLKTRIRSSEYLCSPDITSWKHRFRAKLEPSSCTDEKHALYVKYQMQIHHESRSKCQVKNFEHFLVDTPLTPSKETGWTEDDPGFGSFHQCYYLDEKLIAVSVIDILPECVSAVYFFYDPDYSVLSLGKYSAQREIALVQTLHSKPGYEDLQYYYMGFYIFTCQKMTYKGQFYPSYLLDPETYNWVEFKKCQGIIKDQRYSTFENPSAMDQLFEAKIRTIMDRKKGSSYVDDSDDGDDNDNDDDDNWDSVEENDEQDLDPDEFNDRAMKSTDEEYDDCILEGNDRKKKRLNNDRNESQSQSEADAREAAEKAAEKAAKKASKQEMERVYREITSKPPPGCLNAKELTIMDLTGVLSLTGNHTLRPVVVTDVYKNYKPVQKMVAEYYAHVGEDLANSMILYIR